ncbi:hypothetical protein KIPB_012853, partial [Kipferlia bialata]
TSGMAEDMQLSFKKVEVGHVPFSDSTSTLIGPGQILVLGRVSDGPHCVIVTVLPNGVVQADPIDCPVLANVSFRSVTRIRDDVFLCGGRGSHIGEDEDGRNLYEDPGLLWKYHIPDLSWSQTEERGDTWPVSMHGHVAAEVDGHMFVAGGHGNGNRLSCSLYDPSSGVWVPKPDACGKVYCSRSVVVDGVLHCFGGFGMSSAQHLSCNLSDFSWTRHPDMPFSTKHPAVWSLPPYAVVSGGVHHHNTHALHLGTGEWEDWGEAPVPGVRVSACPLDSATTFIHSADGSFIATSETVLERERVAAFNAAVSLAADTKITAEIERLAPRVESTLHHLRAVIPTPDTDMSA